MEDEKKNHKEISDEDVLKRRINIILKYKEMQRIKKDIVSKNLKYFIKK